MYVAFGPWLPFGARTKQPHLRTANNVYPLISGGLAPWPKAGALGPTLAARPDGAKAIVTTGGQLLVYTGAAGALYVVPNGSETPLDVSRSVGGAYATGDAAAGGIWDFAQWKEEVYGVNYVDDVQVRDNTSSGSDLFSAASGGPPKAAFIESFGDFLVLGRLDDGGDYPDSALHWGTPPSWTPGSDLSDRRSFPQMGRLTGLSEDSGALYVYFTNGIMRGYFVGPPKIIQFDVIWRGPGPDAQWPGALARGDNRDFWCSEGGYFERVGGTITQIDAERELNRLYTGKISTFFGVAVDSLRKNAVFFRGDGETNLVFNYGSREWSSTDAYALLAPMTVPPGIQGKIANVYDAGSGNETIPSGAVAVTVRAWGGGGGAGGSTDFGSAGGGGGAGGYCEVVSDVLVGEQGTMIAYEVGASGDGDGTAGGFDAGEAGGASTVSGTLDGGAVSLSAGGGGGGESGIDGNEGAGGDAGTASGGDTNTSGEAGAQGVSNGPGDTQGGDGGDAPNGGAGGAGAITGVRNAENGAPPGGGGGAGCEGQQQGGDGGSGRISFEWTVGAAATVGNVIGFDESFNLVELSASEWEATARLETSDIVTRNGRRLGVRAARPDSGGAATVAIAAREEEGDTVSFGTAHATTASGRASARAEGRYLNARVAITPGTFSPERAALGIELETYDAGER